MDWCFIKHGCYFCSNILFSFYVTLKPLFSEQINFWGFKIKFYKIHEIPTLHSLLHMKVYSCCTHTRTDYMQSVFRILPQGTTLFLHYEFRKLCVLYIQGKIMEKKVWSKQINMYFGYIFFKYLQFRRRIIMVYYNHSSNFVRIYFSKQFQL